MKNLATIILTCYVLTTVQSQWREAPFLHLGSDEGISGQVRDIAQDQSGYLYFATDQGLYRYDGHAFKFYGHDPSDSTSISEREVFTVISASDGSIYLSTFTSGLDRFDPESETFEHIPLPANGLSDRTGAIAIAEDLTGNIWIGGYHYYLYKYNPTTGEVNRFSPDWVDENRRHLPGNDFRSVFPDQNNDQLLWLTMHGERPIGFDFPTYGLMSFNIETETFSRIVGAGTIRYQDDQGHLWASLWGEFITEIDPTSETCIRHSYADFYHQQKQQQYQRNSVSKDVAPYHDQLLVVSDHVLRFDHDNGFNFFHRCDENRQANCLFVDRNGLLWIGTDSGVEVYDQQRDQVDFFSLTEFGVTKRIYPGRLTYDQSRKIFYIVASTPDNEPKIYQVSNNPDILSKPIETPIVPQAVSVGMNGEAIISGSGNLYQKELNQIKFKPHSKFQSEVIPYLYHLSSVNEFTIGFGSREILWWKNDEKEISRIKLSEIYPASKSGFNGIVQYQNANEILISADNRVFLLNLDTHQTISLSIENRDDILTSDITGLTADKSEDIWISMRSSLFKFNRKGRQLQLSSRIGLNEGITSPTIKEIFCDSYNRIWVFHNSGMDCLDIASNEVRSFGTRNGLPIPFLDPVQVIEIENGVLATVCGNGLIKWHPDSLWQSVESRPAPTIIQNVKVNGDQIVTVQNAGQNIYKLPPGPKVVTVDFQALAFPTDQNVAYQYRISSEQSPWINIGNSRTLAIPNAPYGKNSLEIQVVTDDLKSPVSKLILVNPIPLTKRSWFPFAILALLASIGYGIYHQRIRMIQNRAEEDTRINKKLAELELTALRSQMNPHFMFNSLNSIKTYILEADPDTAADYLSQFAHLIRRILQNSREKLITLQEEIESLQLYINLEQFRFENSFEFDLDLDPSIEIDEVMIPPLILQPYVENAIWHGLMQKKQGGVLRLQFTDDDEFVYCSIDDNGIGREKAKELKSLSSKRHKSMGMGITANRVRILNQLESYRISINVEDKISGEMSLGTRVIARIPKDLRSMENEHYE